MDENNPKYGMVIDFTDLKKIVNSEIVDVFDHTTIFSKNNPHSELADELSRLGHAVIKVDYQPTTEMMLIDFAKKVGARLPDSVSLFSIRLQETASSYAEWFASDNA